MRQCFQSRQERGDLGRVVRVVVDDADTIRAPTVLEPPTGPSEGAEPRACSTCHTKVVEVERLDHDRCPEHRRIFEAIVQGAKERANKLAQNHVLQGRQRLLATLDAPAAVASEPSAPVAELVARLAFG